MSEKNTLENKLNIAHKHCTRNKHEILTSDVCGCFFCLKIFSPSNIDSWLEESPTDSDFEKYTAICPYCNIDSVIGSKSGYIIENTFLSEMNKIWFQTCA